LLSSRREIFATRAWTTAAMATVSSARDGTSQMRNSRVLKNAWGRTSHQIFLPSSMKPVVTRRSTYLQYSSQDR
jgi:hypothetical protein